MPINDEWDTAVAKTREKWGIFPAATVVTKDTARLLQSLSYMQGLLAATASIISNSDPSVRYGEWLTEEVNRQIEESAALVDNLK